MYLLSSGLFFMSLIWVWVLQLCLVVSIQNTLTSCDIIRCQNLKINTFDKSKHTLNTIYTSFYCVEKITKCFSVIFYVYLTQSLFIINRIYLQQNPKPQHLVSISFLWGPASPQSSLFSLQTKSPSGSGWQTSPMAAPEMFRHPWYQ